ncbi:WD40-repeat-containing domain protein [Mycena galopus ATCC 62051]|nr:WD40-repeat-containing domain protein [Mycena galopus ATCC 62051]
MKPIHGHAGCIRCVAFSPDGSRIASGSDDWKIRVWDAKTGKPVLKVIKGHTESIQSVAFSPDGTLIASGSDDKTIRVWDAKTGNIAMKPIQGHTDWIRCVAFSPDGSHITSGSDDKTIQKWDTKTGKPVMQPIEGLRDQTIRVWDAKTGKAVREPIHGHMDGVNSVAFSPDGTCLASGSSDETIRVWELRTCAATVKESGSLVVDLQSASMRFLHCGDNWIRGPNKELIIPDATFATDGRHQHHPHPRSYAYAALLHSPTHTYFGSAERSIDRFIVFLSLDPQTYVSDVSLPLPIYARMDHYNSPGHPPRGTDV